MCGLAKTRKKKKKKKKKKKLKQYYAIFYRATTEFLNEHIPVESEGKYIMLWSGQFPFKVCILLNLITLNLFSRAISVC